MHENSDARDNHDHYDVSHNHDIDGIHHNHGAYNSHGPGQPSTTTHQRPRLQTRHG